MTHPLVFRLAILVPCAIPAVASAQQARVVPPGFADIEGNLLSTYPFGRAAGGMQFVCDPNVVASAPGLIFDVAFRVDADANTYQAYTKQYKLTAAQTPIAAAAMTRDPVANHGGATPTVVFQTPLNVPASSPVSILPKPFSITLPFAAPFTYDPALGGLILTLTTDDAISPPGTYRLDAASTRNDRAGGIVASLAPGCNAAGAAVSLAVDATLLHFGGTLTATITGNSPGAFPLAAFLLGATRQNVDLTPLGMTGCTLDTDILASITVLETGGAYAPVILPIPADPLLEGVPFFAQALGVTATPGTLAGSVTGNLVGLRIGNPVGHSIWSQSMFTTNPTATQWSIGQVGTYQPVLRLGGILP
ncbi:MAG: hypothetical protein HZB39_03210 [Planctomycetes bacterium]|nr:hypothetical protein [Planctomycetota bacterium]